MSTREVPDMGQPTISTRWVICEKDMTDGKKQMKARLVVRGFEEQEKVPSDLSNSWKVEPQNCSGHCS